MAKVLCTLPNAGRLINGVRFESVPGGMLSENVHDMTAAVFASIKGYSVVPVEAAGVEKTETKAAVKPANKEKT